VVSRGSFAVRLSCFREIKRTVHEFLTFLAIFHLGPCPQPLDRFVFVVLTPLPESSQAAAATQVWISPPVGEPLSSFIPLAADMPWISCWYDHCRTAEVTCSCSACVAHGRGGTEGAGVAAGKGRRHT
jgi:hypothetical protein